MDAIDVAEQSRLLEEATSGSVEDRTNIGDMSLPTDVNMPTAQNTSAEKSGESVVVLEDNGPPNSIKSKKGYWVTPVDTTDFGRFYHQALRNLLQVHKRFVDKRGGGRGKKEN